MIQELLSERFLRRLTYSCGYRKRFCNELGSFLGGFGFGYDFGVRRLKFGFDCTGSSNIIFGPGKINCISFPVLIDISKYLNSS